jgi:type IV pilus assembly protein PilE
MSARFQTDNSGFTLVELMIAVAIVAILAVIAYPSYDQYVLRSKRAEGKALLQRIAGEQERFFTAQSSYTNDLTGAKPGGLGFASNASERGCYTATIALNNGGLGYVLAASPASSDDCGDQTRDTQCGSLTIDNLGTKGASGPLGTDCW